MLLLTIACYYCLYSILKVGVACMDDARYLLKDYKLDCAGCVDLRHLVPRTLPSANAYVEYCNIIQLFRSVYILSLYSVSLRG